MPVDIAIRSDYVSTTAGLAIKNGHTINLSRNREGYDRSETTYEKLSSRRIHGPSSILIFWPGIFWKIDEKCPKKLGSTHRWMRFVESSNTEVSSASATYPRCLRLAANWFFRKPSCMLCFYSKIVWIGIDRNTEYKQNIVWSNDFWKNV